MDYIETLARWEELKAVIPALVAEERALREGLFGGTFPQPKEGVNKYTLPDGRIVKGTHVVNREFLKDVFEDHSLELPEPPILAALDFDLWSPLVRVKFELDKKKYNELTEEQRKVFDAVLNIKPGLPSLEVVQPKENK